MGGGTRGGPPSYPSVQLGRFRSERSLVATVRSVGSVPPRVDGGAPRRPGCAAGCSLSRGTLPLSGHRQPIAGPARRRCQSEHRTTLAYPIRRLASGYVGDLRSPRNYFGNDGLNPRFNHPFVHRLQLNRDPHAAPSMHITDQRRCIRCPDGRPRVRATESNAENVPFFLGATFEYARHPSPPKPAQSHFQVLSRQDEKTVSSRSDRRTKWRAGGHCLLGDNRIHVPVLARFPCPGQRLSCGAC